MKRPTSEAIRSLLPVFVRGCFLVCASLYPVSNPSACDWPQWRSDADRSAASAGELPEVLHLQWIREYPPLEPAWADPVNRDRMPFDRVYEPVVMGRTLFVGSGRNDRLTALDTRTGEERWRFYADGPIRLPPAAWRDKLYFASDDGFLYCLKASSGTLVWKFRGGGDNRKVLGNGRLISAWPARGGPVVRDGVVYFAAGIWPFMGVFVHALDAQSGKVVWTNSALGSMYILQPHNAPSFGGVAPQGALVATEDCLLVPGGRSVPACLDRRTGRLLYYHLVGSRPHHGIGSVDRKREGGSHISAAGRYFLNHRGLNTSLYDLATGEMILMWKTTTYPVLDKEVCYLSGKPVVAYSLDDPKKVFESNDKGKGKKKSRWELDRLWECEVDGSGSLIKVGNRLYAGGENVVSAIKPAEDGPPKIVWTAKIEGTAGRIVAADNRLFVVTRQRRIYAFGPEEQQLPKTFSTPAVRTPTDEAISRQAKAILDTAGVDGGYCLAFGLKAGELVEALVGNSDLHVIAVDPDPKKVARLRRRFDAAGLYGTRISVHVGDPTTFGAPPYIASLSVSEDLQAAGFGRGKAFVQRLFHSMRPYGSSAFLPAETEARRVGLVEQIKQLDLPGARLERSTRHVVLTRNGPLPGSAAWTHQNADIANTTKSNDKLVRAPLGLLWFGGSSHEDVLPRHGHGPSEQVIGGRLFIEGINILSARDVYTGRVFWKRRFDDLGTFGVYYDATYVPNPLDTTYNQVHIPGANARGTNYVATPDKVYLAVGGKCLVLDSATGETIAVFLLSAEPDTEDPPAWGYIGVYEDLLIAGSRPARFSQQYGLVKKIWDNFDTTSSRKLVVMDRHTGEVLWTRRAEHAFRHNAIVVGAGKLFCIDSLPGPVLSMLERRGEAPAGGSSLLALDVKTGEPVWRTTEDVFGTWLGYSEQHDILLQSGRVSRDMIRGEPSDRMTTFCGADGTMLWDKPIRHGGPCMIHGETIFLNAVSSTGAAVSLLDGEPKTYEHPLTGRRIPWHYLRFYGCNSVNAGEHLLTFRSGAAGFYDLSTMGGTGNLGGFKSGCTANLIAADGVLNAPDYTRTCTCSYQNQTSLALVHMADIELWTFNPYKALGKEPDRVRRVGINFGAPGDRRAKSGTLWLDYPSRGSPSPNLPISLEPADAAAFLHHSSLIRVPPNTAALAWVAASGIQGLRRVSIRLTNEPSPKPHTYTVRLHFAEVEPVGPGGRVFDVRVQDELVLKRFDIARQAGKMTALVEQIKGVSVTDKLTVSFEPCGGEGSLGPIAGGIEIVAEGW